MISFERWKDGFVMTVEGTRVLRHSSFFPSLYLGSPKEKSPVSKADASAAKPAISWHSMGSCDILNEGSTSIVLSFGALCTIRISYEDRVLRIRFFPTDVSRPAIKLRLGADHGEKLFGAGPSTLYNMKGQTIELPAILEDKRSKRNPTIFSSRGTWIHVRGSGPFNWRFGASITELTCVAMPEEIALGFGKTPAMGMESLTLYKSGGHKNRKHDTGRSRLPGWLQSGLVLEMDSESTSASSAILEALYHAGLAPCALIQDGEKLRTADVPSMRTEEWTDLLSGASARALPSSTARLKSASAFGRTMLSLALSGEGQLFLPVEGSSGAGEGKDAARSAQLFEIAAFSPLFIASSSLEIRDELTARRFIAAAIIFGMLAPYREYCGEVWVDKGLPVLAHPALLFPSEDSLWNFDDQYMFGPDMIIAPTLEGESRTRRLYLPDDEWIHLWTSRHFSKGPTVVDAPEGKPAVFYRSRSAYAPIFDALRQKATRL